MRRTNINLQQILTCRARVARGIAYAKKGDYKEAMKCYTEALEVDPKHVDAFVARGAA